MGEYVNNGKQLLHIEGEQRTHIADAGNNEMAHFLATMANVSGFIPNALRTLSPSWHGDKVAKHIFVRTLNNAIDAANALDKVKKTLFYGRDNNLDPAEGQASVADLPSRMAMPGGADAANIIHAIIGKFTEAGELLEALKACINGNAFDRINGIEEVGDGFWYDAILLDELSSDFPDAMTRVIAKLRARFPDKFSEVNANVRDLAAERAILEDRREPLVEEGVDPEDPRRHHADAVTLSTGDVAIIGDANGGDFAPTDAEAETGAVVPILGEQPTAISGPEAVNRAAESAAKAFRAVDMAGQNVGNEPLPGNTGELHKSPAERLHPLPQEDMAQANSGKRD